MLLSLSTFSLPADVKKYNEHTGDLNGDGYLDLVISLPAYPKTTYGVIKVFFGNKEGLSTKPGWVFNCDVSNYLQDIFSVKTAGDVNGDGIDDLCALLTSLSNKTSGRSTQSLYLFFGAKQDFGQKPVIIKLEGKGYDKYSLRDFQPFDYNGDGFTDILAVSSKRNYKLVDAGWNDTDAKLILYRGSAAGLGMQFETLKDIPPGFDFKPAGDVNHDGLSDLVYGLPGRDYLVWMQYLGRKNELAIEKPFM
jgi:hypothetical protein